MNTGWGQVAAGFIYSELGEVGLKMHYSLGDNGIGLRPKIGLRYLYSKQRLGIEVGIGMVLLNTDEF